MLKLSVDVIYAIAEHIEPNPITFNRLAEVSRDFRTVFTSDWVWRYLNVHSLKSGIRADFMRRVPEEKLSFLREAWGPANTIPSGSRTGDKYLWMGCATRYEPGRPWNIWNDYWSRQMAWCAVHISGHAIRFALNYLNDKELALIAVRTHGCVLQWLHHSLRADREVVLAAVTRGCPPGCRYHETPESILKYTSSKLCDDTELVRVAVTKTPHSLKHASTRLRHNAAVINSAVSVDGSVLQNALTIKKRSLRLAVENYGLALQWAQSDWIHDIELVSAAVDNDGLALEHAAKALKSNEEIVRKAVRSNGCALRYAHENFWNSHDIVLEAVRSNGLALEFVSDAFKADHEIVEEAVRENGMALNYAKGDLTSVFFIVKCAVENNGMALKFASKSTPEYEDLLMIALEHVSLDKKGATKLFKKLYGDWVESEKQIELLAIRNPGVVLALESMSRDNIKHYRCLSNKGGDALNKAIALNPKLYDNANLRKFISYYCSTPHARETLRYAISGDPTLISRLTPEQQKCEDFKDLIDNLNDKGWMEHYPNLIANPLKAQSKLLGTRANKGDSETETEFPHSDDSEPGLTDQESAASHSADEHYSSSSGVFLSFEDASELEHVATDGILSSFEEVSEPDRSTADILSDNDWNSGVA